jgi:hypothetical protein
VEYCQTYLTQNPDASYQLFLELEAEEARLRAEWGPWKHIRRAENSLILLERSKSSFRFEEFIEKAQAAVTALDSVLFPDEGLGHRLARLACHKIYYRLIHAPEQYHRELIQFYQTEFGKENLLHAGETHFRVLREYVESALINGDFLNLNTLIYKVNKVLDDANAKIPIDFLESYLETTALYHFYENESIEANKSMEKLVRLPGLPDHSLEKRAFYRLALLLASNNPILAEKEHAFLVETYPRLAQSAYIHLLHLLIMMENQRTGVEIFSQINIYTNLLRRNGGPKALADAIAILEGFLEKKTRKIKVIDFYPPDWQPVLVLDQWLHSKRDNTFYHNHLLDKWEKTKKRF